MTFEDTDDYARAMDARDPLAIYRERFSFPQTAAGDDCLYFGGHSRGSKAGRSRGDEFAHGESSPDDGFVLPTNRKAAQDSDRARRIPIGPICGYVADAFSWIRSCLFTDRIEAAPG